MIETISFMLNDKPVTLRVNTDRPLLWVLRTGLGLTGAELGCGEGFYGALDYHAYFTGRRGWHHSNGRLRE